jgi:hypothetical protein
MGKTHYVANSSVVFHYVGSSPTRRDHVAANAERFFQRWQALLRASFTWCDGWLYRANQLLAKLQRVIKPSS